MSARDPAFATALAAAVRGRVMPGAPLARYSTYRIGGPATVFSPESVDDAAAAARFAGQRGVPVFALGLGSNVLLPDQGLDALVVRLGKGLDSIESESGRWRLGAGLPAPLAARRTAEQGWAGLHVMVGVPGTVGGGVYMNAGCHGAQWSDVVRQVTVVDRQGDARTIAAADIPFRYRQSGLDGLLVLEAEVELRPGAPDELALEVQKLFDWRQQGTPFNQPCCGSVFKNPAVPAPPEWSGAWTAGRLLESAGLKDRASGAVRISPMHANYFVNTGGATAEQVRALISVARETVRARFGVTLETEVKIIGARGEYLDA